MSGQLSSVRWKDILDVHCTDRVTVASYRCFTVNCKRCLISPLLFEATAVGVPSLHRLHLQCNCSILSLPLYMFVVAVLTRCLRCAKRCSLCLARSFLLTSSSPLAMNFSRRSPEEFRLKIEDFQPLVVLVVLCHLNGKLLVIHRL